MSPTPPARSGTERRPRRRWRWFRRGVVLLVFLAVLAGVLIAAVAIVLRTDVPRRMVLEAIARETGLWVEASEAEISFGGVTVLRDVRVGSPLEDEPLLETGALTVRHTPILWLLVTRRLEIASIATEGAVLGAREDHRGQWNIGRAALVVAQVRAGKSGARDPAPPPRIEVTGSTVRVVRYGQDAVEWPLEFLGEPGAAGDWGFEGALASVAVRGRVAPVGWMHTVEVVSEDLTPVIAPWAPSAPSPIAVSVEWEGSLLGEGLDASMRIERASMPEGELEGSVGLAWNSGGLTLRPGTLTVRTGEARGAVDAEMAAAGSEAERAEEATTVEVRGGVITVTNSRADWSRVFVHGFNTSLEAEGSWDLAAETGRLSADWSGREELVGLRHRGSITAEVTTEYGGLHAVRTSVESEGALATREWSGSATLEAMGPEWTEMEGALAVPDLLITGPAGPVDLSGFELAWAARSSLLTLRELVLPGASATMAEGEVDLADLRWMLSIATDHWQVPGLEAEPVALRVDASGWGGDVDVSQLAIDAPAGELRASGSYRGDRPEPFMATVDARLVAPGWPAGHGGHGEHAEDELDEPEAERPPPGEVRISLDAAGTLAPRSLHALGRFASANIPVGHGVLDPIDVVMEARATDEELAFQVEPFMLLGGEWNLSLRQEAGSPDAVAKISSDGASLERLAALMAPSLVVTGSIDAAVEALLPNFDVELAQVAGEWSVSDAAAGDVTVPAGGGRIGMERGRVRLHELALEHGGARATGSVEFDALDPTSLDVDLRTRAWPVHLRDTPVTMLVDSRADAVIDLAAGGADGELDVGADVLIAAAPVGRIDAVTRIAGRTVSVDRMAATVLEGTINGRGVIPLDNWTTLSGEVRVRGVDLSRVSQHAPGLVDLRGVVSADVWASPAETPLALEPLWFGAEIAVEGGSHHGLAFEGLSLSGYAGPQRTILDSAQARVAGGTVHAWSRLSWHGQEPFLHVNLAGESLQVEQLVRVTSPETRRTPGVLAFNATMAGYTFHPHRAFGEARATVTNSDLAALPVISHLHAILNLSTIGAEPSGEGAVVARLEGDTLFVEGLRYANKGTEMVGAGRIDNVWLGLDSPVSGSVAGAANPLGEGDAPLGEALGRLLLAATDNTASVRLSGTLRALETEVVTFEDVAESLNRLLGAR